MSEFLHVFDPKNESHVVWLRDVSRAMKKMGADETRMDFEKIVHANPFKGKVNNMMDWAYTHFQISMKYANAVLEGEAFVPTSF